jgi:hypothetical protein
MKIAVLGCGPAGLLACHAACKAGHTVAVFSKKQKSKLMGAQYLHRPSPLITKEDPEFTVQMFKVGTSEGYSRKVYGHPEAESSWGRWREGEYPAWRLNAAYNTLWYLYQKQINEQEISPDVLKSLIEIEKFDAVISSIPPVAICLRKVEHAFTVGQTYVEEISPESFFPNTIIYNGAPLTTWHRASNLEGRAWMEFAKVPVADGSRGVTVSKPQSTDCDCWPEILRVGRYGRWTRDVLSHEAYYETLEWLR